MPSQLKKWLLLLVFVVVVADRGVCAPTQLYVVHPTDPSGPRVDSITHFLSSLGGPEQVKTYLRVRNGRIEGISFWSVQATPVQIAQVRSFQGVRTCFIEAGPY